MSVFVDTSALYAVLDGADAMNRRAAVALRRLHQAEELITNNYVVVESVSLARRRLPHAAVRALVDELLPVVRIEWVDAALHGEALAAFIAAERRSPSFVDWVSFRQMARLGIRRAFAFDGDFEAQGFELVA